MKRTILLRGTAVAATLALGIATFAPDVFAQSAISVLSIVLDIQAVVTDMRDKIEGLTASTNANLDTAVSSRASQASVDSLTASTPFLRSSRCTCELGEAKTISISFSAPAAIYAVNITSFTAMASFQMTKIDGLTIDNPGPVVTVTSNAFRVAILQPTGGYPIGLSGNLMLQGSGEARANDRFGVNVIYSSAGEASFATQ